MVGAALRKRCERYEAPWLDNANLVVVAEIGMRVDVDRRIMDTVETKGDIERFVVGGLAICWLGDRGGGAHRHHIGWAVGLEG